MPARFALVLALLLAGALALRPGYASADVTLSAAGSTALRPLVAAAAEAYRRERPGVRVRVAGGGSRAGLLLVAARLVDVGDSDILATRQPALVDHKVVVTGFSVIVNPASGVAKLTRRQVRDLFAGRVSNWKAVGGNDGPIVPINRPPSSGTRAVFVAALMGADVISKDTLVQEATASVVAAVRRTPGAISYAASSATRGRSGLTEVAIDGAAPSNENVTHGRYPFWSYGHMYTHGPATADVARFIGFLQRSAGLVVRNGYIPLGAMNVVEPNR